jgi:hypothetical protein
VLPRKSSLTLFIPWGQSAAAGNHLAILDMLHTKTQYDDTSGWRESLKNWSRIGSPLYWQR